MILSEYETIFGILLVGMIIGVILTLIVVLIYLAFRDQRTNSVAMLRSRRINLEDSRMGRMNTPPRMHHRISYQQMNPNRYHGRMDTPPGMRQNISYQQMNPNGYHARMDTPPALKKDMDPHLFCPYCGKSLTNRMRQILQQQSQTFCEFCGKQIRL